MPMVPTPAAARYSRGRRPQPPGPADHQDLAAFFSLFCPITPTCSGGMIRVPGCSAVTLFACQLGGRLNQRR